MLTTTLFSLAPQPGGVRLNGGHPDLGDRWTCRKVVRVAGKSRKVELAFLTRALKRHHS
jgi:hypothetical protein